MEETNSPVQNNSRIPVKKYNTLSLNFESKQTPIDYFKLSEEIINDGKELFNVSVEGVDFGKDRYFDINKHIAEFGYAQSDTTVFNFQTGKGKSSTFYELVELYVEGGYYVIVCSPFQKLVEKDFVELEKKEILKGRIYNYLLLQDDEAISDNDYRYIVSKPVHVMTINCLLQNPGEDFQDQALIKRRYLSKLKQYLIDYDRKVVIFFDELHEATHNFKSSFLRHLLDWEKLTFKCFVSSATFSFASIPVIQMIALLTDCNIKVYQADRIRNEKLANLHLHITDIPYSQYKFSSLNYLKILIEQYQRQKRKINILTGHKSLANALTNNNGGEPLVKAILSLSPNLITSDSKEKFNPDGNNIGTAFKTGVDICDDKGVLIIIIPAIKNDNKATYGVFTDGLPSLIQSISRIRNEGDIHIFMYKPPVIIDLEGHKSSISELLQEGIIGNSYLSNNAVFDKLKVSEGYKNKRSSDGKELTSALSNVAPELGFHEYTFGNYLLESSTKHSIKTYPSMGKYLSPYILWASINNQFCNAELNSITYLTNHYREIKLEKDGQEQFDQLLAMLPEEEKHKLNKLSLRMVYSELPNHLESSIVRRENAEGKVEHFHYLNKFKLENQVVDITTLKTYQSFKRLLLQISIYLKTGRLVKVEKDDYFRTSMANAVAYNIEGEVPELIALYRQLAEWKKGFITFVKKQLIQHEEALIIDKDYGKLLPEGLYKEGLRIIKQLREKDALLKCFSFFQKVAEPSKEKLVGEFETAFINITGIQRSYKGERKYYLVNAPLINDSFIQGVDFVVI